MATASALGHRGVAADAQRLLGAVSIVGDAVVGFIALSGVGAVVVTYLGFTDFHPAPLPD